MLPVLRSELRAGPPHGQARVPGGGTAGAEARRLAAGDLVGGCDDDGRPYLDAVRGRVAETYPEGYRLLFHVYGRDGVMGRLEPVREVRGHELGLVIEVVDMDGRRVDKVLVTPIHR